MNKILAFIIFTLVSTHVYAGVTLEGDYQLAGPLTHKGATTPGKSHLYINLTGDAAKQLYEKLDGVPAKDECTGYMAKGKGNVGCYETEPGKNYFCGFSVNLEHEKVEAGLGGCF